MKLNQIVLRIMVLIIALLFLHPMLACSANPDLITIDDPGVTEPGSGSENETPGDDGGDEGDGDGDGDGSEVDDEDDSGDSEADGFVISNISGQVDSMDISAENLVASNFARVWDTNDNQTYDDEDYSIEIKTSFFDAATDKLIAVQLFLFEYNLFQANKTYYYSPDYVEGNINIVEDYEVAGGNDLKSSSFFTVPLQTTEYVVSSVVVDLLSINLDSDSSSWSGDMEITLADDAGSLTVSFSTAIEYI